MASLSSRSVSRIRDAVLDYEQSRPTRQIPRERRHEVVGDDASTYLGKFDATVAASPTLGSISTGTFNVYSFTGTWPAISTLAIVTGLQIENVANMWNAPISADEVITIRRELYTNQWFVSEQPNGIIEGECTADFDDTDGTVTIDGTSRVSGVIDFAASESCSNPWDLIGENNDLCHAQWNHSNAAWELIRVVNKVIEPTTSLQVDGANNELEHKKTKMAAPAGAEDAAWTVWHNGSDCEE